jgi:hypothetical protein
MDPLDALWLLAQQPLWLGYLLCAGGIFSLGLIVGLGLR